VAHEPVPEPRAGEVLIRVAAVGLCGSDRHWYREASIGDAALDAPLVLGHEFSGVILEGPRAGEHVVADPGDPCGACDPCLDGRTNVCTAARFAGFGTTDGALRSTMAWPERLLHRVPDALGDDEAALLEPLAVAIHALDLASPTLGMRAGVYGCGPLGLMLIGLLRLVGASDIVATDRLAHRVAAAREIGASHGFVVDESEPGGSGGREGARAIAVDVAFEVAGDDAAIADAVAAVRPGGRVVLVGIPDADRSTFPAGVARRKELSLQLCRRMAPTDLPRAIDLVEAGKMDLSTSITHRYPLDEVRTAFETLTSRRGLKVIVNPGPPR
jgi:L-iditol 2-dehydrogenase